MTTTWDIIDTVMPGVEITHATPQPMKAASQASRFVTIVAGLLLVSSSTFAIPTSLATETESMMQHRRIQPKRVTNRRVDPIHAYVPDTTDAMSGAKLARAFSSLFQPAQEEPEYESDYFFN